MQGDTLKTNCGFLPSKMTINYSSLEKRLINFPGQQEPGWNSNHASSGRPEQLILREKLGERSFISIYKSQLAALAGLPLRIAWEKISGGVRERKPRSPGGMCVGAAWFSLDFFPGDLGKAASAADSFGSFLLKKRTEDTTGKNEYSIPEDFEMKFDLVQNLQC